MPFEPPVRPWSWADVLRAIDIGSFIVMKMKRHWASTTSRRGSKRNREVPVAVLAVGIVVLAVIIGITAFASVGFFTHRMKAVEESNALVYQGVSIDGAPVGGLTKRQLNNRMRALVARENSRMRLTVIIDGKAHSCKATDLGITFDTAATSQYAWESNKPKTRGEKLAAAFGMWRPAPKNVAMRWKFAKPAAANRMAKKLSASAYRAPVDKTVVLSGPVPAIKAGIDGRQVPTKILAARINQAIRRGAFGSSIRITTRPVPARQTTDLHSIVIDRKAHTVTLYERSTKLKHYSCAVGQPEFPTPVGDFFIESKQVNPTWVNPHGAWSQGMPETIPGGPESPLGQHALALNTPGVLIHGVPEGEYSSIGSDASHGCIRMMPNDVSDLFGMVKVKTKVFIR